MSDQTTAIDPDDDEDPIPSGVEAAALAYTEAGLLMPPVPNDLADAVEELDDMEFATTELDLTDRDAWLRRASDPAAPPAVAFGHIGHGIAGYALYYQLVTDALAVFVSLPFGSAYSDDPEAERAAFNDTVEQLEELVVMIELAKSKGRIAQGQRLIVAVEPGTSGWQLPPAPWKATPNPIHDALTAALKS